MNSFSSNTKKELLSIERPKNNCCAFSITYGFFFLAIAGNEEYIIKKTNAENGVYFMNSLPSVLKKKRIDYDSKSKEIRINKGIIRYFTIAEYKANIFKCEECLGRFLRSLFLMCGCVTDPKKDYRLELVFDVEIQRDFVLELLLENDFQPKTTRRNNKYILYLRNSEQIENFLTLIGAINSMFEVVNSKIYKEFVNNANRAANCDTANINKSLTANQKYIDAISNLVNLDKLDILPEQLRETALKRIEFKELNFEQLGKKFDPPISKSGIYHRLEKILDIYESIKNN